MENTSKTINFSSEIDEFFEKNQEYVRFLESEDIPIDTYITTLKNYSQKGYRCIRLKKGTENPENINQIQKEVIE
jgi:hypothetical protein